MAYKEVVRLLSRRRKELKLSLTEIAEGSHVSVSQVSRILNFKSNGSREALIAIGKYLDIPASQLHRELGEMKIWYR
jgi:transcriptional regulator with XRE-family HTH domain